MALVSDWTLLAAQQICKRFDADRGDVAKTQKIIQELCPFKAGVVYEPVKVKVKENV